MGAASSDPLPRQVLAALADFLRERLGGASGEACIGDSAMHASRTAVVFAAAPFASTSYARARLLRQVHAAGLLGDLEVRQAEDVVGVATC